MSISLPLLSFRVSLICINMNERPCMHTWGWRRMWKPCERGPKREMYCPRAVQTRFLFASPFNCFAWRVHAAGLIDYLQPPAAAKAFTGIILRVFVSYRSPTHKAGRHGNTAPRGSWMRKEVLGGSLILPGCWMLLGSGDLRVVVVSCKWLFHLTSTSIFVTFLFYTVFYID